jgi:hypothetical protein
MEKPEEKAEGVKMAHCDKCGKDYAIGEWPFCPHGVPHGMMTFVPYWDEHVSSGDPVWVTSLAQRRRLMKENHMDYRGKKVGMPGCEV